MTDEYRPLLPPGHRVAERPKPGSWLDRKTQQMVDLLSERHNLGGFDPDATYASLAADLRARVESVAVQLGIGEVSAQRYFDDEMMIDIVDGIAGMLADEKPVISRSWTATVSSRQSARGCARYGACSWRPRR